MTDRVRRIVQAREKRVIVPKACLKFLFVAPACLVGFTHVEWMSQDFFHHECRGGLDPSLPRIL